MLYPGSASQLSTNDLGPHVVPWRYWSVAPTKLIKDRLTRSSLGEHMHTAFRVFAPTAAGMRKVPALQVVQAPVFASQELQLRGKTVHDWHSPGVPNSPTGHSAGHAFVVYNEVEGAGITNERAQELVYVYSTHDRLESTLSTKRLSIQGWLNAEELLNECRLSVSRIQDMKAAPFGGLQEFLGQADAGCRQHERNTLHNTITLSSSVGADEDVKWTMGVDGN
eukprot:scaffold5521_cov19-Tisochrysis_lutea.AAC.1